MRGSIQGTGRLLAQGIALTAGACVVLLASNSITAADAQAQGQKAASTEKQTLTGRITGPKAGGGKPILVLAWPANEDSVPAIGQRDVLEVVSKGTTDANGNYRVDLEASKLERFADKWGNVNVSVFARGSKGGHGLALAVGRENDHAVFKHEVGETATVGSTPVEDIPVDVDNPPTDPVPDETPTATSTPEPTTTETVPPPTGPDGSQSAYDTQCYRMYKKDLGLSPVLVGQRWVSTAGVTSDFTYASGASSTMGIGVSSSGAYGSFSGSGTHARSSTATINFPNSTGWRRDWTYFRWGLYSVSCVGTAYYKVWYEARTTSFAGGSFGDSGTQPTANYCVPMEAGSSYSNDWSDAVTWSAGASTSKFLGINLTSNTGYEEKAAAKFTFSYSRRLCGTNGYPGGAPRRLVATI